MSTTTASTAPMHVNHPDFPIRSVTFRRVLASEWVKLRSLRSTSITLGAAIMIMIAFGWLFSWARNTYWDTMRPDEIAMFNPMDTSIAGYSLAPIALGVLGVLLVTGEYSTGMIRSTFAAVPQRLPVVWAKAGLFALVTFVLMLVASSLALTGGQMLLGEHGTAIVSSETVRAVLGVSAYLATVGVLAVALGFIVRSTAAAVSILLGLLLVLPTFGLLLPGSWQDALLPYLPSNAGTALFANMTSTGSMSTPMAAAVLLAWPAVAVLVALLLVQRRDA